MSDRRALSDLEMFHLRRVAIHEAGHAAIAAHYGVQGEVRIFPVIDRKAGEFQFNGIFIPERALPDDEANRQFGLAGVVAEAIDGLWDSVVHRLIAAKMSRDDKIIAGTFDDRHVVETTGLIRWHWSEIESRATAAMEPWLRGPAARAEPDEATPT